MEKTKFIITVALAALLGVSIGINIYYVKKCKKLVDTIEVAEQTAEEAFKKIDTLLNLPPIVTDSLVYKTMWYKQKLADNEDIYKSIQPTDDLNKNIEIFEKAVQLFEKQNTNN